MRVHLGTLLLTQPAQFFLERGDFLVAQLQQPLADFHLTIQVANAAAQFVVFPLQAVQVLVTDRQLILQRGGIGGTAGGAGTVAVAHAGGTVRGNQGNAAVAVGAGAVTVRLAAAGGVHRGPGRSRRALGAQALPFAVLHRHPGQGFAAGKLTHLAFRGQAQYRALADQVHVVFDKGVRVALLDRQHHLLHGHTGVGTGALGDTPHGIGGAHPVGALLGAIVSTAGRRGRGLGTGRSGGLLSPGRRRPGRLRRGRGRAAGGTGGRLAARRGYGAAAVGVAGRIKQDGVFAHQPAGGPEELHQKIQIGFPHRLVGGDAQLPGVAGGIQRHIEIETIEKVGAFNAGVFELLLGPQLDQYLVLGQVTQILQLHGHVERFIKIGVQLILPHPQCSRQPGRHGRQGDKAYPKSSEHCSNPLLIIPSPLVQAAKIIATPFPFSHNGRVGLCSKLPMTPRNCVTYSR